MLVLVLPAIAALVALVVAEALSMVPLESDCQNSPHLLPPNLARSSESFLQRKPRERVVEPSLELQAG